ncbi:MAG: FG-GAP-like repeat-containing protein [Bacteroidales bacterium]|nr:FG-GAP-like repeat-containing protein [Bacteroidales bacterium]MDZ4204532.1 FG-GAP-like repeat-containing protein [Bacteroidales bacterium]
MHQLRSSHIIVSILSLFFVAPMVILAQTMNDFGFNRDQNILVSDLNNQHFSMPWVGGLNACQVHKMDLNSDGIEDLVVFDRHGNRLLTFLNTGFLGYNSYLFAPEFQVYFPVIINWMQLLDYDNDGKKDIFTYTTGGIKVYKNISTDVPHFLQVTKPFIRSRYGSSETNLLVTSVDYPAIGDLDGDGDLDILTFWGLGSFVEMHTNQSVELFGNSDSLKFIKTHYCWGQFAENDESNSITLDTCVNFSDELKDWGTDQRHTGSTLLTLDMNGDGVKDLVLGDIDYPGLLLLTNAGTNESAHMIAVDTLFPSGTLPVRLFSFPVASYVDINNDGKNDMVVSPFDPSLTRSLHHRSMWLYKNNGTNEHPDFEFITSELFQDQMIDLGAGASPVFADINNDGLLDMLVGNYGYNDTCFYDNFYNLKCKYVSKLAYFRNVGTTATPEFRLINRDFAGLSSLRLQGIHATFGDLNGNGRLEMLVGNANGNVLLFENINKSENEPDYVLKNESFNKLLVGAYSTPQLIDLNRDGLLDLVLGQVNGKLSYFENQGNAAMSNFVKVTDNLGNVNVTDPMLSYNGYSTPFFFKATDGNLRLFVGSESGKVFYYKNIEDNLNGSFTLVEERLLGINEGIRTSPAVAYLTTATYPDMVLGNYAGGLVFFRGAEPQPYGVDQPGGEIKSYLHIFPNPANGQLVVAIKSFHQDLSVALNVYDITGRLIHNAQLVTNELAIVDVSIWKRGLYIFKVIVESMGKPVQVLRRKVIVSD